MTAKLEADELVNPATAQASEKILAAKTSSMTNKLVAVESGTAGETHSNPAKGDVAVWGFGVTIPTSTKGQIFIKPGSTIKVTYLLAKGLTYVGLKTGTGLSTMEPTLTKNADGTTLLTWNLVAPSENEQAANDINYLFNIRTTVNSDVVPYTSLKNKGAYSANYYDDTVSGNSAVATIQVAPSESDAIPPTVGTAYAVAHRGPVDGAGNTATTSGNPNKTFYTEDNPTLGFTAYLTPAVATSSTFDFAMYTLHYYLDPNLQFTGFNTGTFYFRPDSSDTNPVVLAETPYATLAVDYGDGVYHALNTEVTLNQTLTKDQLVAMGLDTSKTVQEIILYFHKQGNDTLPSNVNSPDYGWAPAGMYGTATILTQ